MSCPGPDRDFPMTLPSLRVAVFRLPVPMSQEDYDMLIATLTGMHNALLAQREEDARVADADCSDRGNEIAARIRAGGKL